MSDEIKKPEEEIKKPEEIVKTTEPTSLELSEAALKQVAGGATTQADAPTESVGIAYSKIKISY